jgi:hypothetical protein
LVELGFCGALGLRSAGHGIGLADVLRGQRPSPSSGFDGFKVASWGLPTLSSASGGFKVAY